MRWGSSIFGIFDVVPEEWGNRTYLPGRVSLTLMARAPELFAGSPVFEKGDVLLAKLSG
jgi:hypothetical protein